MNKTARIVLSKKFLALTPVEQKNGRILIPAVFFSPFR